MSRAQDIADFAAEGTYVKVVPKSHRHITPAFNVALFAFLALKGLLGFLLTGPANGRPPLAFFSVEGVLLSTLLDLIRMGVVILISAAFLKAFWERLVSPLGSLRPIRYGEAMAILLMIALVFGG